MKTSEKRVRKEFESRRLLKTRRRKFNRIPEGAADGSWTKRFAQAAQAAGPLFTLFGAYLSTRPDWLPARECRDLRQLDERLPPTTPLRWGPLLSASLKSRPDEVFSSFDSAPLHCTALHQWHRAVRLGGAKVIVKFVRPEAEEFIETGLPLLPVMEELEFSRDAARSSGCRHLVEDFVRRLDRDLDLEHEARSLEDLADRDLPFDAFVIPKTHGDLMSRRLLIIDDPGGTPLATLPAWPGTDRAWQTRRLCQAWFEHTLLNHSCPVGPLASNLFVRDGEKFALCGGLIDPVDAGWSEDLLGEVAAAARDDPDQACEMILRLFEPQADASDRDRLTAVFRQAEAFRSGGWSEATHGRGFADTLFMQWRLARREGYRPKPHALSFIRGLTDLEKAAHAMAPENDALAEAVDDVRIVAAAVRLRENLGPTRVQRLLVEFLPLARDLVGNVSRLERFLRSRPSNEGAGGSGEAAKARWPAIAGAFLILAAVVMISTTVVRRFPEVAWLEPAMAGVFVAAASLLFFVVGRKPDR